MKKQILTTAILALAIISCKDKTKDQPKPKPGLSTKQTAMIGKDWKIKSLFADGKDITLFLPACDLDDIIFHFNDAEKGYSDAGASKCENSEPQRSYITWKLVNNETRLITTGDEGKDTFEVMSVSASELKLEADNSVITLKN